MPGGSRGWQNPCVLSRLLAPFRHAGYRRLALAMAGTTFAAGAWVVGLVWEVIRLGGGPADQSMVATANAVGVLLPALLAGVVADRVPQKWILLVVCAVEAVAMGATALLSVGGHTDVAMLTVASGVVGLALAFYYPAYSAWLPALVPERDLQAVNGFEGMVRPTLGQAVGPAVAGALVGAANPGTAIGAAAVAALLALLATATVPLTPLRRALDTSHAQHPLRAAWTDLREGFGYMVRTPWLLSTLLFASLLVLSVMGPIEVLLPYLIKDRLGGDAGDHAWALAAFGVGGALGSLVMAAVPMPRRYLTLMILSWGVGSLPLAVMGLAQAYWVVLGAAFVLGVLFEAPMVIWGTLLQRRVPPALLGRVSSLDFFVSVSLMPISMALAGPLSEAVGMTETFVVAGLLPGVFAVVTVVAARLPADEIAHPLRDDPSVGVPGGPGGGAAAATPGAAVPEWLAGRAAHQVVDDHPPRQQD